MKSILRWFGFSPDNSTSTRDVLSHPKDLLPGDIIKFGFIHQDELSAKKFQIIEANTYMFGPTQSTSFTIKGANGSRLWMTVVNEDAEEFLRISKKLNRRQVLELFSQSEFEKLFDPGSSLILNRENGYPKEFKQWTASSYKKVEDASKGFYVAGDFRYKDKPPFNEQYEPLDFYLLEDNDEKRAIEVEVYEEGTTEVSATVYLDLTDIEEMWPIEQEK